jgi:phage-related protein (TIGR01555 family)
MKRNVKSPSAALSRTNKPVQPNLFLVDSQPSNYRGADGLENVVAGLGTSRDKMSYTNYNTPRALTRYELENMYRTSWLAKRIINAPAEDMTREWRTVTFESEVEDDQDAIERAEVRFGLKQKITECLMWSRLYGGALLIIGTKDADMSKPLIVEQVKKDDLQWLQIIDRWRVSASGQRTTDLASPNFGLPEYYTLAESAVFVHWTRVIRFNGQKLPYFAWLQNAMWDDSELQHVYDSLQSCDVTSRGIATMVFEANLDVVTVPELNELASSKDGEAKIVKRFQLAAMMKSFNRTLLLGEGETYEKKSNNFSNLDKILLAFQVDCCGAADMPMTRLFGQSAAGMNSSGDGELRNYYDRISAEQEADLRPKLEYLDQILVRSELGMYPDDYCFEFNSLWQQSDAEIATTQKTKADRDAVYLAAGVLSEGAIAKELLEDGTYKTLTQEDVDMAVELSLPMDENGNVIGKPTLKPTPEEQAAEAAKLAAQQTGKEPTETDPAKAAE